MSENATNSPKHKMDCGRVAQDEILESYLLSRLGEEDRDAFEQHYFECARCFDELQTLQAIRAELPRARAEWETKSVHPFIRWAPAAGLAAAVLAVTVVLWMRPSPPSPEATKTPSQAQVPERPKPQQPEPQPEPTVGPQLSLEPMRVEPPRYEAPILRSTPDEATARFQRGMGHYSKADYAAAIGDLRTAEELDPDAAHIRFFLGISHLMLGQDDAAIDRLQATIALGDSPYLEEAHLYLAKAFLRRSDLGAAEIQLKRLMQLRGPRSDEAQRLLTQVERLKPRR